MDFGFHLIKPLTPDMLIDASDRAMVWINDNALKNEEEEGFKPEMLAELDEVINQYAETSSNVIRVLTQAQEIFGYLPSVIQRRIARGLNMHPSEIRAIVSFYSSFRAQPETPPTPRYVSGIAKAWDSVAWMTGENAMHSVNEFIKSRQLAS